MATTPYLLGRLVAALGATNVVDNAQALYEEVCRNPAAALAEPIRNATTDDPGVIAPIMEALDTIPSTPLAGDDLSAFALGYYHQRAELRRGLLPSPTRTPQPEPRLEARYELRLEPDLREWIRANGGDKMVRALLRAARERMEAAGLS